MPATGNVRRHGKVVPAPGGVEVVRERARTIVRLWGDHDLATAGATITALTETVADEGLDVVVDLGEVTFMDCSTIGVLVGGRSLLARSRQVLSLRSPSVPQRRLLECCGLTDMIEAAAPGGRPQPPEAASPLESWVAVPPTERAVAGTPTPVERDLPQEDPDRARR